MREIISNLAGPAVAVAVWLMLLANVYVAERPHETAAGAEACLAEAGVTYHWDASGSRPAESLACP